MHFKVEPSEGAMAEPIGLLDVKAAERPA